MPITIGIGMASMIRVKSPLTPIRISPAHQYSQIATAIPTRISPQLMILASVLALMRPVNSTWAAGGITSAIVGDLATASGGTFVLLDLVAEPARDDAKIALFRQDRDQLKRVLIDEARAKGEKPTPVAIDKQNIRVLFAGDGYGVERGVVADVPPPEQPTGTWHRCRY